MVAGEPVLIEQDLNTIDWQMLAITNASSIEKHTQSFMCGSVTHLGVSTGASRVQCPICFRFSFTKELGRCPGVPTADYPLKSSNHCLTEGNSRKRKRTEMRTAHELRYAPCNECLDSVGEDDGRAWGRCDNSKCWSRRGEAGSGSLYGGGVDGLLSGFPVPQLSKSGNQGIGLVCPDCSPEGGLGCAHKWICDMCAFWGNYPLVWECPGCQMDFCDKCPEMQDRCVECGCSDLCRDCRKNPGIIHEIQLQMAMRGEAEASLGPLFAWRCRLCNIPVCKSCAGTASWGGRIDDCPNCEAQLCMGCRSLMKCNGCGEEMCQLCPMESLVLLCERCARTKDPFSL